MVDLKRNGDWDDTKRGYKVSCMKENSTMLTNAKTAAAETITHSLSKSSSLSLQLSPPRHRT